jgi:hypothetical protein
MNLSAVAFVSHFSLVAAEAVETVLHLMVNDLGLRH